MQSNRVTDVIRMDHIWFRSQFAALNAARDDAALLTSIWTVLSARLEVHAAAEETLFYPRLLKDDSGEEGGGGMAAIANNGGQPVPKPTIAKPVAMTPKIAGKR